MRQVDHDELVFVIQAAIRKASNGTLKAMTDWRANERLRGRVMLASIIADQMRRLEILSSAPPPPFFRYPDLAEPPDRAAEDR